MTKTDDDAPVRRSVFLAVAGILTLLVAAWGMTGGFHLPNLDLVPWLLVIGGVLVGVVLILSGLRRG
ncbi:hypothetical protein HUN08_03580 [Gordonia sp. X0973]|uniref:hypothetical protein n=1 Tax=Gordonia sp. X0973 TaxID=2742602 RepID=UPI000F53B311|nr:hypothetical protein [Gordonia sp. X0973]QKT06373.1 hypothetical protein HUN08_03580 [Gordonia sp. X0973]